MQDQLFLDFRSRRQNGSHTRRGTLYSPILSATVENTRTIKVFVFEFLSSSATFKLHLKSVSQGWGEFVRQTFIYTTTILTNVGCRKSGFGAKAFTEP
jgi:hypothetical protein